MDPADNIIEARNESLRESGVVHDAGVLFQLIPAGIGGKGIAVRGEIGKSVRAAISLIPAIMAENAA